MTSKSTIQILTDFLSHFGYTLTELAQKKVIAVGKATAKHLSSRGITSIIAKEETAEGSYKL